MIDIGLIKVFRGNVVARYDSVSFPFSGTGPIPQSRPKKSPAPILVVDDSESDRFFLMRAFAASGINNPVQAIATGDELIRYLTGTGKYCDRCVYPLPHIVLLDIQMPAPNGLEVLQWRQLRADLPPILWIAMSNFNSVATINKAYQAGANTFLTKPLDAADIRNLVEAFEEFWTRIG